MSLWDCAVKWSLEAAVFAFSFSCWARICNVSFLCPGNVSYFMWSYCTFLPWPCFLLPGRAKRWTSSKTTKTWPVSTPPSTPGGESKWTQPHCPHSFLLCLYLSFFPLSVFLASLCVLTENFCFLAVSCCIGFLVVEMLPSVLFFSYFRYGQGLVSHFLISILARPSTCFSVNVTHFPLCPHPISQMRFKQELWGCLKLLESGAGKAIS